MRREHQFGGKGESNQRLDLGVKDGGGGASALQTEIAECRESGHLGLEPYPG